MFTMEITRLIERCKQGDADALGELYKAYAQQMRGVCRRYISDEQTVEDVLHDAFLIIFTSFDRLRDVRRLLGAVLPVGLRWQGEQGCPVGQYMTTEAGLVRK